MAEIRAEQVTTSMSEGSRWLRGTTFLGLEHSLYMLLVAVVPVVLFMGVMAAFNLWVSKEVESDFSSSIVAASMQALSASTGVWSAAALLVLGPTMWLLGVRTRAEFIKRPAFKNRLAYRLPIYVSLGLLGIVKLALAIWLLSIVLQSIVMIGANTSQIGSLYLNQFLPGLIGLVVVDVAGFYVMKMAKGIDKGARFGMLAMAVSVALAVTLLISAAVALHNNKSTSPTNPFETTKPTRPSLPELDFDSENFRDSY